MHIAHYALPPDVPRDSKLVWVDPTGVDAQHSSRYYSLTQFA
jgi:hypothetical protein